MDGTTTRRARRWTQRSSSRPAGAALALMIALALASGCQALLGLDSPSLGDSDAGVPEQDAQAPDAPPAQEICDDGIDNDGDGNADCDDPDCDCPPPGCGDGNLDSEEQCDDGNTDNTDDCLATCILAQCGDGFVDGQEPEVEQCDDIGESAACNANCTIASCGDGIVNVSANEGCDDGNGDTTDDCPDGAGASCQDATCGDGFIQAGVDQCDDAGESAACNANCTIASCGDGIVNGSAGESCDDGNGNTGDGCPDGAGGTCQNAFCGDGFLRVGVEACDDGNNLSGDGCSAVCAIECGPGESDCFGTCVNTDFDLQNCGACGVSCSADQTCALGVCESGLFPLLSYDPALSFPYHPGRANTVISIAFDGTLYWVASGGTPNGVTLMQHDLTGAPLATFAAGVDFRSVFAQGDGTSPIFARGFSSAQILVQSTPGVFINNVALVGGTLNSQSNVAWDGDRAEFVAHLNGTITRWSITGALIGTVTLSGYGTQGNEASSPQNRGVVAVAGHYLTYADGTLSAWSVQGIRVDTAVLNNAGATFDANFTISFANGMVFIGDGATWRGYDLFP